MTVNAIQGGGSKLYIGDGGSGAGVQASRTIGTSNQQVVIRAKVAGVAGNSKTVAIVVAGNNTPFSFVVTPTSLVINSATNGSGVATTTVAQALAALYLNDTFNQYFQATFGAGDGTGVLVAAASAALSGGAAGGETFTQLAEVRDITGPDSSSNVIEVTTLDSDPGGRDYQVGRADPGALTFTMYYQPRNAQHKQLQEDQKNNTVRNFKLEFPDGSYFILTGRVSQVSIQTPTDGVITANVSVKLSGKPTIVNP